MTKTKCEKLKKGEKPEVKEKHTHVCKKCGSGSSNPDKLCKPQKKDQH